MPELFSPLSGTRLSPFDFLITGSAFKKESALAHFRAERGRLQYSTPSLLLKGSDIHEHFI